MDQTLISLGDALRGVKSSLKSFLIELNWTKVTDVGVIALIDALSSIPSLSTVRIDLDACTEITDKVCEKIVELIISKPQLTDLYMSLERSSLTQRGVDKIKALKSLRNMSLYIGY